MINSANPHATSSDVKQIITLGFSAMLILMTALVAVSLTQLKLVTQSISTLVSETNAKTQAAYEMREAINLRADTLKAMHLAHDPFEKDALAQKLVTYAGDYREARERLFAQQLSPLEAQLHQALNEQTRIAQPLNQLAADMIMEQAPETDIHGTLDLAAVEQSRLLSLLNTLVTLERRNADEALHTGQDRYRETRNALFVLAGISLLLGGAIAFLVIRRVAVKNRRILYHAQHDVLTGLFHRSEMEQHLNTALEDAATSNTHSALLFINLDRFKLVNETCGHLAGDELLTQIGQLLSGLFSDSDILARHGADEFSALAKHRTLNDAIRLAQRIITALEDYRCSWQDKHFNITVSIGVIPIQGTGETLQDLLSAADSACNMAKTAGGNQFKAATLNDQQIAHHRQQAGWVGRIQAAIVHNQFELYGQPVVGITADTQNKGHIELLLRLKDPQGGIVPPDHFIPAAERYSLMPDIDRWVIRTAIATARHYIDLISLPTLMINLSGQSISNESFLIFLDQALREAALPAGTLCFEITETAAVADLGIVRRFVETLKPWGCKFALDDFGTGFSSFSYLKSLPVDYLKIDGSFIKEIATDATELAMVKSIHEIGHILNKKTVAEFVENDAILNKLKAMGVDYAQGYGIAAPQPIAQLLGPTTPGLSQRGPLAG